MRRAPDYFGDRDPELIAIAKRLKDALRIEELLTQSGVDYLLETDTYQGGVVFRTERVGVFFYVLPESADGARETLRTNGFRVYERPGD